MSIIDTRRLLRYFIDKYGEKAILLLRAIYEISQDPTIDHRLGDFSFKHLVMKLASMGFSYNPSNLIRVLEKDIGLIEKSYSSSNQTWWRIADHELLREALGEYMGFQLQDPRVKALLIKYKSLEPTTTLEFLKRLAVKDTLTAGDKELFKNFVFHTLDKIVELINEMEKYEEVFHGELAILREILNLADIVANKIEKKKSMYMSGANSVVAHVDTRISKFEDITGYEGNTYS